MNENEFDEFFRKKLMKYSSPVAEDMWKRIQQKKEKERKGFFFRWSLAGLLLIFLTAGYFILHTNKSTDTQKSIYPTGKQNIEKQKDAEAASKQVDKSEPLRTSPGTAQVQQSNNGITSPRQPDTHAGPVYYNKPQNKKSTTRPYFPGKNILQSGDILERRKPAATYSSTSGSGRDSSNINVNKASDSLTNMNRADEDSVKKKYPDTSAERRATTIIPSPADSSLKKTQALSGNRSKKEANLLPGQRKSFLEAYASPDIPFSTITSGNANIVDFLNRSFKTQISYTAGVRVGMSFGKHFSVKTGVQYSQINVKFNDSMPIVNRYKSVDIPFLIGYSIGNPDFRTTINAGFIFNPYSWYKGKIIDGYGIVNINAANIYKHNTGVSLYLGLSFATRLNNKIQLFTEPYFRYRFSYMTKPQASFNQKIHVAGALFGLKYNFQKARQHQ